MKIWEILGNFFSFKPEISKQIGENENLREYLDSVGKTIPRKKNPQDITDFNYKFDDGGQLVNMDTGLGFHWVNRAHYDALSIAIRNYVQNQMINTYHLQELNLPLDSLQGPKTKIFISNGLYGAQNPPYDHLVILLNPTGKEEAGLWSTRLCVYESISRGSILPYLEYLETRKTGILVLNPNKNKQDKMDFEPRVFFSRKPLPHVVGKDIFVEGNSTDYEHFEYVWKHVIPKIQVRNISIISFSRVETLKYVMKKYCKDFISKVSKITFSADFSTSCDGNQLESLKEFMEQNCQNWICSDLSPGVLLEFSQRPGEPPKVSSGTTNSECIPYLAMESIFHYLGEK
eukprot:TRINITY_DN4337_c0_g1_i1.p1 TRINITY_DN4337_c0_g1~~TRINITY_DN4337_c0_g1_i1.p1  ORF type:complete len:345 (-),score=74.72 TRINITY_DN4337_c0_g1_i1:146-1180(-)